MQGACSSPLAALDDRPTAEACFDVRRRLPFGHRLLPALKVRLDQSAGVSAANQREHMAVQVASIRTPARRLLVRPRRRRFREIARGGLGDRNRLPLFLPHRGRVVAEADFGGPLPGLVRVISPCRPMVNFRLCPAALRYCET